MNHDHNSPSRFVQRQVEDLAVAASADAPRRRALDLATGRGRHALLLARQGFQTFGVDIRHDAVRDAMNAAAREGLLIRGWCADLTRSPLPAGFFDVIVVARYLQRDLFDGIKAAVNPGGCVIYETFTTAQLAHGTGPKSPDHLLQPGELRSLFADWNVRFYEEVDGDDAVARLVAQRATSA